MKHYYINRKGNESEQLVKSLWNKRKTIRYYRYHEDCIEVTEIEPGDEGVTEEDIRRFYAAEDHEVYENLKARRPRRPMKKRRVSLNGRRTISASSRRRMATSLTWRT